MRQWIIIEVEDCVLIPYIKIHNMRVDIQRKNKHQFPQMTSNDDEDATSNILTSSRYAVRKRKVRKMNMSVHIYYMLIATEPAIWCKYTSICTLCTTTRHHMMRASHTCTLYVSIMLQSSIHRRNGSTKL